MAFSLVQKKPTDLSITSVGPGATSVSITFNSTPTANNLLIANAAFYLTSRADSITFSDNKSNSWRTDGQTYSGSSGAVLGAQGSAIAATVSATFTVTATISASSGYMDMSIQEFSGNNTGGTYWGNGTTAQSTGFSISVGPVSPTTGSELIVATGCDDNNNTITLSWTGATELTNDVSAVGVGAAYKESSSAETAQWNVAGGQSWAVIQTYKAAAAGTPTLEQTHYRWRNDDSGLVGPSY